jgi:hypothetical protein
VAAKSISNVKRFTSKKELERQQIVIIPWAGFHMKHATNNLNQISVGMCSSVQEVQLWSGGTYPSVEDNTKIRLEQGGTGQTCYMSVCCLCSQLLIYPNEVTSQRSGHGSVPDFLQME